MKGIIIIFALAIIAVIVYFVLNMNNNTYKKWQSVEAGQPEKADYSKYSGYFYK